MGNGANSGSGIAKAKKINSGRWAWSSMRLCCGIPCIWKRPSSNCVPEGLAVHADDVARLSPLVHHHINFQGRYSFALSEAVARGELRPLRNPDEFSEEGEWYKW